MADQYQSVVLRLERPCQPGFRSGHVMTCTSLSFSCIPRISRSKCSPASQYAYQELRFSIRISCLNIQTTVHRSRKATISDSQLGKCEQVWSANVLPSFPGTITILLLRERRSVNVVTVAAYFVRPVQSPPFSNTFTSRVMAARNLNADFKPYKLVILND